MEADMAGKRPKAYWIVMLVFAVFVTIVFLNYQEQSVDWVQDYQAGIKKAKEMGKPVLLTLYKDRIGGRFTKPMFEDTFANPDVIQFVHQNFVPILINAFKHPEIAKRYNFDYDPTHIVVLPESEKVIKTRVGYDPPALFMSEMKKALEQINSPDTD